MSVIARVYLPGPPGIPSPGSRGANRRIPSPHPPSSSLPLRCTPPWLPGASHGSMGNTSRFKCSLPIFHIKYLKTLYTHMCIYICIYIYIYVCVDLIQCVHIPVHNIQICTVYIYIHIYIYIYIYMCVCLHCSVQHVNMMIKYVLYNL